MRWGGEGLVAQLSTIITIHKIRQTQGRHGGVALSPYSNQKKSLTKKIENHRQLAVDTMCVERTEKEAEISVHFFNID